MPKKKIKNGEDITRSQMCSNLGVTIPTAINDLTTTKQMFVKFCLTPPKGIIIANMRLEFLSCFQLSTGQMSVGNWPITLIAMPQTDFDSAQGPEN